VTVAALIDGRARLMRLPEWSMFVQHEDGFAGTAWPGCSAFTRGDVTSRWVVEDARFEGTVHCRTAYGIDPESRPMTLDGSCRMTEVAGILYGYLVNDDDPEAPGIWFRIGRGTARANTPSGDVVRVDDPDWVISGSLVARVFQNSGSIKDRAASALAGRAQGATGALATERFGRSIPAGWRSVERGLWASADGRELSLVNPNSSRGEKLEALAQVPSWLPAGQRHVEEEAIAGGDLVRSTAPPPEGWTVYPFALTTAASGGASHPPDGSVGSRIAAHRFPALTSGGDLLLEDRERVLAAADDFFSVSILEPDERGYWSPKFSLGSKSRLTVTNRRIALTPRTAEGMAWQFRLEWGTHLIRIRENEHEVKKKLFTPAQPANEYVSVGLQYSTPAHGPLACTVSIGSNAGGLGTLPEDLVTLLSDSGERPTEVSVDRKVGIRLRTTTTSTWRSTTQVGYAFPSSLVGKLREGSSE
jgi:hypothetical protein